MTEHDEIIGHLRRSLSVVLDRKLAGLSAGTRILDDLDVNSMRFIELMSLEDTLGLSADTEILEPEDFPSVGSLADFIQTSI